MISISQRSHQMRFKLVYKNCYEQECIPVGCVPPACCPYLPACTAPGVSAPDEEGVWCLLPGGGRGGVCSRGSVCSQGGVSARGGVTSLHWARPAPLVNRILHTRFWKYYLAQTSLRAVKMSSRKIGFGRNIWETVHRIVLIFTTIGWILNSSDWILENWSW